MVGHLLTHMTFPTVAYASTITEVSFEAFFLVVLVLFFFFSFLRADSVVIGACFALKKKRVVSKHVKTHDGGECKAPAAEPRKQWRYSRILAFAEISSVECKPEISVCVKENITLILF